jgi:hypothetical protein
MNYSPISKAMKTSPLPYLLLSACLATGLLAHPCSAADSTAESKAGSSPLDPIAFLVDGAWTGRLPAGPNGAQASIEMRFTWTANHQGIRFDSYFVQGEKRSPYTSGMYGWNPGKKKIAFWYSDSDGSLHEGTVTNQNGVLVQDFTITDKDGKVTTARSRLTRPEPNVFTNEISVQKEGAWQKIAEVRYERSASANTEQKGALYRSRHGTTRSSIVAC